VATGAASRVALCVVATLADDTSGNAHGDQAVGVGATAAATVTTVAVSDTREGDTGEGRRTQSNCDGCDSGALSDLAHDCLPNFIGYGACRLNRLIDLSVREPNVYALVTFRETSTYRSDAQTSELVTHGNFDAVGTTQRGHSVIMLGRSS
jgi:hypothetical protein